MSGKQPLYTALGWAVWQVAKRYARRRVAAAVPSRKMLALGVAGVAAAGVAASLASGPTTDD